MYKRIKNTDGFTLIELIVVVGIIGILVGIAQPKFTGFTKDADVAAVKSDARVLSDAAMLYNLEKDGWPTIDEELTISEELSELLENSSVKLIEEESVKDEVSSLSGDIKDYGIAVSPGKHEGSVVHLEGVSDKNNMVHYNESLKVEKQTVEKVLYNKYSIAKGIKPKEYNGGRVNFDVDKSKNIIIDFNTRFFDNYEVDYKNNRIIGIGEVLGNPSPEDVIGKYFLFTYESDYYNSASISKITDFKNYYYNDNTKTDMVHMVDSDRYTYNYPVVEGEEIDVKGELIEQVEASMGDLPNGGIKDGYWYELSE